MSNFEVIDRRRQNKVVVEDPVVVDTRDGDKSVWDGDVVDLIALMPQPDGAMVVMGRSIGLRGDGTPFCADYWFDMIWNREMDWTIKTRKRLDTFLGCDCVPRSPCSTHRMYLQQWIQQDIQRIRLGQSAPPPRALEVFMRAEMAAQTSGVVVPG